MVGSEPSAATILAHPRYMGGLWLDTRLNWSAQDRSILGTLARAKADLEKSADALGRSPTSIAWQAKAAGLSLPESWAAVIRPKRKGPREAVAPRICYPFVIRMRDEHRELLEVNRLVPHGLPGREDVCQAIMLALWQREVAIEQLRQPGGVNAFIRAFRKSNYENAGYALSLDAPKADGRSWHESLSDPSATSPWQDPSPEGF